MNGLNGEGSDKAVVDVGANFGTAKLKRLGKLEAGGAGFTPLVCSFRGLSVSTAGTSFSPKGFRSSKTNAFFGGGLVVVVSAAGRGGLLANKVDVVGAASAGFGAVTFGASASALA